MVLNGLIKHMRVEEIIKLILELGKIIDNWFDYSSFIAFILKNK